MKTVIIQASARSDGDTARMVKRLSQSLPADTVDIRELRIGHYDYAHRNRDDDFLPLMHRLVPAYDRFVFATPVYWYSMSGRMKVLLDRFTDLLEIEKELGRQLRGKSLRSYSCSADRVDYPSVSEPFRLSAKYLGMRWEGHEHWEPDAFNS